MTSQGSVESPKTTISDPQVASSPMALLDLMVGSWRTQAVSVAATLGIADLLEDGPRPLGDLACATETHPRALYRLLRALASIGILAEDDNGRFALMPLAQSLRTKAPGSLRDFAVFLGSEGHWRPWGNLLYSVRTGGSAFEQIFGMQLFDYFAGQPEAARVFDAAMTNRGNIENQAIATAFDFPSYELRAGTVVDVGGGRGSLIATLLQRNTNSRGILFDLPHVMPRSIAFTAKQA